MRQLVLLGWLGVAGIACFGAERTLSQSTPELSMLKLVWSETLQKGPFEGTLQLTQPKKVEDYYCDLKVVTFPTIPGDDVPLAFFTTPPFQYSSLITQSQPSSKMRIFSCRQSVVI